MSDDDAGRYPPEALAPIEALLARVFLKEVDADLLAALTRPDLSGALGTLEPAFRAYVVEREWDASAFDDEAAEYARLFLIPGGVSPFAVSWTAGEEAAVRARLQSEVSALYEVLRIAPRAFGLGNVPADHIGMLLSLDAVARQQDPSGGLAARATALLTPWASRFAAAVVTRSDSPLYRGAARLLRQVIRFNGAAADGEDEDAARP